MEDLMRGVMLALIFTGGALVGAMVNGIWYERRYKRALELEREREKMRYYRQMGEQDWGGW